MLGSKDEKIHDLFRHKLEILWPMLGINRASEEWSEYLENFGCARIIGEWVRADLDFIVIYDPYDEVARKGNGPYGPYSSWEPKSAWILVPVDLAEKILVLGLP